MLDHHILTENRWKKAISFEHPKLILKAITVINTYKEFKIALQKKCESMDEAITN